MTILREDIYAVEVPSMAFGLDINNYGDESELMYMLSMEDIADDGNDEETLIVKKLPPGPYKFLFCTKDATEEQAKLVVDSAVWHFPEYHVVYVNYAHPVYTDNRQGWNEAYNNARESLCSLLASKGLYKPNYAILKKVE